MLDSEQPILWPTEHLRRGRPAPAAALLASARELLEPYAPGTHGLAVDELRAELARLRSALRAGQAPEMRFKFRVM